MIPYFGWQTISVGPVDIQVWGLFVALGISLGLWVGYRQAVRNGLDGNAFLDVSAWSVFLAIVLSRLFFVLAYRPDILASPLSIIRIWDGGMSALGGFLGAGLAFTLFFRKQRQAAVGYLNAAAFGLPWGYAVGRIGCFLIHDHVGLASGSFLAVNFPGGPRLDLGLIHAIFGLSVGLLFVAVRARNRNVDLPYFLIFFLIYGLGRFGLDFLRDWETPLAETRWFFLTPTQVFSVPIALSCLWLLLRKGNRKRA
ncbi:prolipoprotein diacylglyceryl transferase [Candidatus Uhrbacteria bacterium]|nr:prolipoprotein diacylglyceryl transferase [Candidatus Uhrbacteria bacterium]